LALLDFNIPFVLETNTSAIGLGVVFSHNRRPLAYFNKALCLMNLDLSINEKEYMVILMVVERWRYYLEHF
jgi:hypothetical protein